ncbi:glycosyl hydrolase [Kineococcus sp. SYSU DK002]|uniref:glycosyl hydrolase n=1 Tax=Kineococcus sp. SYSU DK002 TaxID=3383123 RepID=UPI003D7DA63A
MDTTHQESPATGGPQGPRRHGRRKVIGAGIGVLAVAAAGGGVYWATRDGGDPVVRTPAPDWTPKAHVPASDLDTKWVGIQTHDTAAAAAFGEWLGRPLDVVVVFNSDANWAAISGPWFAMVPTEGQDWGQWVRDAPDERTLVVSTGLVPADPPDDWRERGAAGEYDEHWRLFASNLVSKGLGSSIVRLGWELNGDWYETHYIGETQEKREQWKAYFRRIVETISAVEGAAFEIDFNIAEGQQDSVVIDEMYPGDDWVDIIGVDVYDSYISPIDPTARWEEKDSRVNSLSAVIAFAHEHDKPISIPEWAMVAEGSTQGGGDSPEFIDQIADAVVSAEVRYQAYFNVPDGGVGMTLADAPNGSATFRQRFGASGDAGPTDA